MAFKKIRRTSLKSLVLAAVILLGAGTGVAVTTLVGASGNSVSPTSSVIFPTNQNGQTYGSASGVSLGSEPDLIRVYATNLKIGYVYRSSLWAVDGTDVNSLSAAQAYMKNSTTSTSIPVYELDGTTVIGKFVIPAASSEPVITAPPSGS